MEETIAVRCNHCEYMTTDLDIEKCPNCGKEDALMDMSIETIVLQNNANIPQGNT